MGNVLILFALQQHASGRDGTETDVGNTRNKTIRSKKQTISLKVDIRIGGIVMLAKGWNGLIQLPDVAMKSNRSDKHEQGWQKNATREKKRRKEEEESSSDDDSASSRASAEEKISFLQIPENSSELTIGNLPALLLT